VTKLRILSQGLVCHKFVIFLFAIANNILFGCLFFSTALGAAGVNV
jgi:hypothetical protein